MTVEEKKERNRKYGAICARAKAMGIMQGDAISAIMDIESADRKFNLRKRKTLVTAYGYGKARKNSISHT